VNVVSCSTGFVLATPSVCCRIKLAIAECLAEDALLASNREAQWAAGFSELNQIPMMMLHK
jgi:hypothetical protein